MEEEAGLAWPTPVEFGLTADSPRWFMRVALAVVCVLVVLLAVAWVGLHFIPSDLGYEVETEFAAGPADDHELEEWLRAQPGVWGPM